MRKLFLTVAVAVMAAAGAGAQVIVNPNGTHSVVHGNVVVNPNGTHSTVHGNVIVNPNGTHSVVNGNVVTHSDGTHSIVHGNTVIDSDGTHSVVNGNVGSNSDGSHSVVRGGGGVQFTPRGADTAPGGAMSVSQRGFFAGGNRISVREAKELSRPFPEAMRHIRTGQFVYGVSLVAACGGGYMIGWQIGSAAARKGMNVGALAAGVAIAGGAIGLTYVTVGQYRKAAAAYNSATGLAELPRHDVTLALAPTVGGLGLRLTF